MRILINLKHPVVIFFIVVLLGLTTGVIVFEHHFANRFFPGISLGGINVGGNTYQEVRDNAQRIVQLLEQEGVQVVLTSKNGQKTIVIPKRSTGLTPDVVVEYFTIGDYKKAIDDAFAIGHTGSLITRLKEQVSVVVGRYEGDYAVVPLEDSIRALLQRESHEMLPQPEDARFTATATRVTLLPEKIGEKIDVDAVVAALQVAVRGLKTNRLQAQVIEIPAGVTAAKIEPLRDFVAALAKNAPLKLSYNGKILYLGGARLAGWLTVDAAQPGVVINVAQAPLKNFVRQYIDGDLPGAPINSRFAMQGGKLVEIVPGVSGIVVDTAALAAQLEALLNARYVSSVFKGQIQTADIAGMEIPISFRQEYPLITSSTIAQYKITDLIGSASTSFKGSTADRIVNIKLGVERSSGSLIAPGEEFSLVGAIGEVTEETGFTKEYVIKGDRSIKEAGGGLCQLATTVFRGALNAGLPITERQNHSYVVGYYGPGLDATIYGPHPDLKFVNDTGRYVLFQMRTEGTNLIAELYGTSDHRVATTTEPALGDYIDPPPTRYIPDLELAWGAVDCHDQPRKGLTAVATTTVTYADGTVRTKVFNSVYTPWPKVCLVGIKK